MKAARAAKCVGVIGLSKNGRCTGKKQSLDTVRLQASHGGQLINKPVVGATTQRVYVGLCRRFLFDQRARILSRLQSSTKVTRLSLDMTIKLIAKFCSVAVIVLVVITALGPANWQLRTALGWQIDHVLGYFAITLLVCFAWPRPFVVGAALIVFAALLEGLQAFTPDRSPNLVAALCGGGGALAAALLAALFIRTRRRRAARIGYIGDRCEAVFLSQSELERWRDGK